MKKLLYLCLAVVALASCKDDENPGPNPNPKPTPLTECWEVYDQNFDGLNFAHKFDTNTNCIYVSKCAMTTIGGDNMNYVPFIQKISADGKTMWTKWCQIQTQKGTDVIYYPDFDITSDSQTIHLYSVPSEDGDGTYEARINKVSANGQLVWGEKGIKFCDFTQKALTPTDGNVVADENGGAWVAASNNLRELVVRHVDKDGNLGVAVTIDAATRAIVNHPRMLLNPDGGVMLVAQRSDIIPHYTFEAYESDFDLFTITDDGEKTEHPRKGHDSHLISGLHVAKNTRVQLIPYRENTHVYATLRIVETNGQLNDAVTSFDNTGEIHSEVNKIVPKRFSDLGFTSDQVTTKYTVNDDHNLVILSVENFPDSAAICGKVITYRGNSVISNSGKMVDILSFNPGEKSINSAELVKKQDDNIYLAYGAKGNSTYNLNTLTLNDSLKIIDSKTALTRDKLFVSSRMSCTPNYFSGKLRLLFYNEQEKSMFGAKLKVD